MNLISSQDKAGYEAAMNDLHDTFSRDIVAIKEIKTPVDFPDKNDDYDFVNDKNEGEEEFTYSTVENVLKARIKYIDRQDKEYAFISTLGGEQINLTQDFGIIRIKVKKDQAKLITDASRIHVEGNNTNVIFRDRPHGIIDTQFVTFYLQRTA